MGILSHLLKPSALLPSLVLIPVLTFVASCVYNVYFHPLRRIPGPRIAAMTQFWEIFTFLGGRSHFRHIELHKKYGPVVRLGPNTIIINDPNDIAPYWNWDKSDWWLAFRPHPTYIPHASMFDVTEHKKRKKLVMHGYQMSEVIKSEHKIDKHINTLVKCFKERVGTVFDVAPWTQYAAFDIVMDIVFSKPFGFLESSSDVDGIIKSLHGLLVIGNLMAYFTGFLRIVHHPWVFPYVAPQPTDKTGPGRIYGLAREIVQRRHEDLQNNSQQYQDILQSIIDRNHVDKDDVEVQKLMSWPMLEQESTAPIVAGSDSVAAALRTAILQLSTNQAALRRLRSEVDAADEKGLLSDVVQFKEIKASIPFIEPLCKEILRIYPIIGSPSLKVVRRGNAILGGYYVPDGTNVGMSHWAVSRNPSIWGDDADVFRPERWEDPETVTSQKMDDSFDENGDLNQSTHKGSNENHTVAERQRRLRDAGFVFFSNGPMMCTGRHIAQLELFKVIVQLFRLYDFQIVNSLQPVKDVNHFAMVQWDFMVKITERQDRPKRVEKAT